MIKSAFAETRAGRRGYTLIEIAIVLLIAAVVLGALWVAATHVWDNYRAERAAQQVTKIAQNIREYYMNAQNLPAASGTDITATLDRLTLFPVEMRRNPNAGAGLTPIDHPFNNALVSGAAPANGSFHVFSKNCPNGTTPLLATCFRISMQGIDPDDCTRLLEAVPVTNADLEILGVGTQAQGTATLQDVAATPTGMPVAIAADVAASWCSNNGATNEVDWDFKLH
jgi:prepilin-type N-terminal cleavage/methylation domain-containing protein